MPVGSKWEIYSPSALAYGNQENGVIPPNSAIIFTIELLEIVKPEANDNAQNQKHEILDGRVEETYVKSGTATNKSGLYDPYIKAFRWSSDRIDNMQGGIIAFVSNGSWIKNEMDGFRKCLELEFSSIYVFNLRGDCRTSGELRRKEAGNVFGLGSRTPISITILVKHPKKSPDTKATIYYHEIGDYLTQKEKLEIVEQFKNILSPKMTFEILKPNEQGDWLNQRSDLFSSYIPIGYKDDKQNRETVFVPYYSCGLKTQRDAWCYNSSKDKLSKNIKNAINFYNEQCAKLTNGELKEPEYISTKFSWTRATLSDVFKNKMYNYSGGCFRVGLYRPFFKQNLFLYRQLNEMMYQIPTLYPTSNNKNICICVTGIGVSKDFTSLVSNYIPDLQLLQNGQCFPLYYFVKKEDNIGDLFEDYNEQYIRRDGITDFVLEQCKSRYSHKVTKEDIFYYVYGLLHSNEYRTQFAADLKKMLPRIPLVDIPNDFFAFSKAGRELADLHLNYESVPPYPGVEVIGEEIGNFHVDKIIFAKKDGEIDKTTLIYNSGIKIANIPLEAYDYVINGKSAIEWIMDRYQVKVDKDSDIKNDPNDWGLEHNNPRYILDLILSIITVSMKTNEIVKNLPKLDLK